MPSVTHFSNISVLVSFLFIEEDAHEHRKKREGECVHEAHENVCAVTGNHNKQIVEQFRPRSRYEECEGFVHAFSKALLYPGYNAHIFHACTKMLPALPHRYPVGPFVAMVGVAVPLERVHTAKLGIVLDPVEGLECEWNTGRFARYR